VSNKQRSSPLARTFRLTQPPHRDRGRPASLLMLFPAMSAQREPNLALPRTFAPINLLTGTAGIPPAMSAQREPNLALPRTPTQPPHRDRGRPARNERAARTSITFPA
jgi:hypothetical protein